MKRYYVMLVLTIVLSLGMIAVIQAEIPAEMNDEELYSLYGEVVSEIGRRSVNKDELYQEAGFDGQILFRKIPWGISATEFKDIMLGEDISGDIRFNEYKTESWEFEPDDGEIKPIDSLSACGFTYTSWPQNLQVSGFDVEKIEGQFIYTFDDENLYTDENASGLISARYDLTIIDGKASYEILKSKMESIYGAGEEGENSAGWLSTGGDYHTFSNWTVWYGLEDTGVVLCHILERYDNNNTVKNDKVYISYGKSNSLMLLADLKGAMAREELKKVAGSDDISGL